MSGSVIRSRRAGLVALLAALMVLLLMLAVFGGRAAGGLDDGPSAEAQDSSSDALLARHRCPGRRGRDLWCGSRGHRQGNFQSSGDSVVGVRGRAAPPPPHASNPPPPWQTEEEPPPPDEEPPPPPDEEPPLPT